MKALRFCFVFAVLTSWLTGACFAAAGPSASLLPRAFAGWHLVKSSPASANPLAADPANAAVLKEYDFTDVTTATYSRDDGRQLMVKAARFQDASGAFGAYTFYRTGNMHHEEICDQGSSLGPRVLFFRGKILVDAIFTRLSGMSAAELRELSDSLPKTSGSESKLPDLVGYLPKQSYVNDSAKYIIGPLALETDSGIRLFQVQTTTLGNISTRAFVQTGDNVEIGGFIVQGAEPKKIVIRAIGPELTQYGIPNPL